MSSADYLYTFHVGNLCMEEKMQEYIPGGVCVCTASSWGVVLESQPWITGAQGQESELSVCEQCSSLYEEHAAAFWWSSENSKSLQPQVSHDATELTGQFLSFNGYQCFHLLFFLHIFLQKPMSLPAPQFYLVQSSHFRFSHLWHFAFTGQMRQILNINHPSLLD